MQTLFRAMVVRVVLLTLGIVIGPVCVALLWWAGTDTRLPARISTPTAALVVLGALAVLLTGVALLVGFWSVGHIVRTVEPPLARMAAQAERLGEGVSTKDSAPSGIAEIDRLAAALNRGSAEASKRLAAEREFAADASHQLRTPLTALLMRLEEISSTDDLEVVAEEAAIAIGQVERLSGVVDDLLARTRSGAEEVGQVGLDTVLAGLQREWQHSFARVRRTIHVTGERGLRVRAAPGALSQIISTLFENALTHGAGTVTVAARRVGPSVVVEVSDQGAGIPPALAPHVFERSVSSKGSGLGLALARDLAQAQGGRLELVEPSGALFAVFLSGGEGLR